MDFATSRSGSRAIAAGVVVWTLMVVGAACGDVIHVPADHPQIQGAIDAASDGDVVLVAPGVYAPIDFSGKAITVRSVDPADPIVVRSTIIDGDGDGDPTTAGVPAVRFDSGEERCSVLDGLMIYPGDGLAHVDVDTVGAGVYCADSGPIVRRCLFEGGHAGEGVGVYAVRSTILVERCTIVGATASVAGAAIKIDFELPKEGAAELTNEVRNNLIEHCICTHATNGGAGLDLDTVTGVIVRNNVFTGCAIDGAKGIAISSTNAHGELDGNICHECIDLVGVDASNIFWEGIFSPVVEYNLVWQSNVGPFSGAVGPGNLLEINPEFTDAGFWDEFGEWDPAGQDYTVAFASPTIGAGPPDYVWDGAERDFAGADRASGTLDMGIFEFAAPVSPVVVHVDSAAPACGVGESWQTAYDDLQTALERASLDGLTTIDVAFGLYEPRVPTDDGDPRSTTFLITDDLQVTGDHPSLYDPGAFESVLRAPAGDVSYHVVTMSGTGIAFEGFRVSGGRADEAGVAESGAGIRITDGSEVDITFCTVSDNEALGDGGGVLASGLGTTVTVDQCEIMDNNAGVTGGGVAVVDGASVVMTASIVSDNDITASSGRGAGIGVRNATMEFHDGTIRDNDNPFDFGGGIAIIDGAGVVTMTDIRNNLCTGHGAGVYVENTAGLVRFANCDIFLNDNINSGTRFPTGGIHHAGSGQLVLTDCGFSGNFGENGRRAGIFNEAQLFVTGTIGGVGQSIPDRFVNVGTLSPGEPGAVGSVLIDGEYTQDEFVNTDDALPGAGVTLMEFDASDQDALDIADTLDPKGEMHLALLDTVVSGDEITIGSYGAFGSPFKLVEAPLLPDGRALVVTYMDTPGDGGASGEILALVVSIEDLVGYDVASDMSDTQNGGVWEVHLFDMDGVDGDDLVALVGSPSFGAVVILLNQGIADGEWLGFSNDVISIPVEVEPRGFDAAELDATPGLDLVIAHPLNDQLTVMFNPLGAMSTEIIPTGDEPVDVGIGEFDGLPGLDFVVINLNNGAAGEGDGTNPGTIGLFFNQGDGSWQTAGFELPGGQDPAKVDPGDLDNDKDLETDIGVLTAIDGHLYARVFEWDGDFQGDVGVDYVVGEATGDPRRHDLRIADMNGDGFPDIVATRPTTGEIAILENDNGECFESPVSQPVGPLPRAVSTGDFDGDGDRDLCAVVGQTAEDRVVQVLQNLIDGGEQLAFTDGPSAPAVGAVGLAVGNVDQDLTEDVVVAIRSVSAVTGSAEFTPRLLTCTGDVNADFFVDVSDLIAILADWGPCDDCSSDTNGDGAVNVDDLLAVIQQFGQLCTE